MLIGHYAPALVLSRLRPSVRLGPLFVATQLVDVGWGLCILAGVEHARIVPGFTASNDLDLWDMSYTHSLVATGIWALAAGLLWERSRNKADFPGGPSAVDSSGRRALSSPGGPRALVEVPAARRVPCGKPVSAP
jgi:hypothetical protein